MSPITSLSLALVLALAQLTSAQIDAADTIWSVVILTLYGDRTPLVSSDASLLTPLGAQQLYSAGSLFREIYISPPENEIGSSKAIPGLDPNLLDNTQVFTLSTLDEYVVTSAQAFMQGLYPPLATYNQTSIGSSSILANGSAVEFPLGGYQYPQIYTASANDPDSIWIAGHIGCPAYDYSGFSYLSSPEFARLLSSTQDLYSRVEPEVPTSIIPNSSVSYENAYFIFDYLNYEYQHNKTVQSSLSYADLTRLRTLADEFEFNINGNMSSNNDIRTVAGQAFAGEVLGQFLASGESLGEAGKLTLLFSTFEPMISFASLAGLTTLDPNFFGMPELGSSMVFELYSTGNSANDSYPDPSDLNVRFMFRNGTNSSMNLDSYAMFGRSDSDISMTFTDFLTEMGNIMIADVGDWCTVCNSSSIFCPGYTNSTANGTDVGSDSSAGTTKSGMNPVVAGVIGAVVTLAVLGILLALAMVLGGMRFYQSKAKRRSELGGFKGAEKLASDQDLTLAGATTASKSAAGATVVDKGHERIGSWELSENNTKARDAAIGSSGKSDYLPRPSYEADGDSIHNHFEPTKVDETV
ncbi:hypothetical protein MMC20_006861 [Loxospora ochrophaea]|nr:hypothetical protein [Loxospora ochrophaea]